MCAWPPQHFPRPGVDLPTVGLNVGSGPDNPAVTYCHVGGASRPARPVDEGATSDDEISLRGHGSHIGMVVQDDRLNGKY